jgi:hypothetical protein
MCKAVSYTITSHNTKDEKTKGKHRSSVSHPVFKLDAFQIQVLRTVLSLCSAQKIKESFCGKTGEYCVLTIEII